MSNRTRNICFTSWDPLQLDPSIWPDCTYCIWQRELSAANNRRPNGGHRLHWQGYAEFSRAVSWGTLHLLDGFANPPAHFEARRGSQKQAIAYCSKEDTRVEGPFTWGEPKHQGQSVELLQAASSLSSGKSMLEVARENPVEVIRFASGLTKFQLLVQPTRSSDQKTVCFVFYGAGGTGKSTFARKLASFLGPRTYHVPSPKGSGLYWDGYSQGDVVIIDEFKGNRMTPTEFNQLVDAGPHQVPVHGGTFQFNSKYIIITTNVNPLKWWDIEFMYSLKRRIVLWPIFRRLSYNPKKKELCLHCQKGLCAFHHP